MASASRRRFRRGGAAAVRYWLDVELSCRKVDLIIPATEVGRAHAYHSHLAHYRHRRFPCRIAAYGAFPLPCFDESKHGHCSSRAVVDVIWEHTDAWYWL